MGNSEFENTATDLEACVLRIEEDDLPISEDEIGGLERILNEARIIVSHTERIENHISDSTDD